MNAARQLVYLLSKGDQEYPFPVVNGNMTHNEECKAFISLYIRTLLAFLIFHQDICAEQQSVLPFLPENHQPFYNAQLNRDERPGSDRLCWGHESDCNTKLSFSANFTKCQTDSKTTQNSRDNFFNEADFGYIKQRREKLLTICEERSKDLIRSSLLCTNQLQFCVGKNIRIDLRGIANSKSDGSLRYNMDVLKPGQITGHCHLRKVRHNIYVHM